MRISDWSSDVCSSVHRRTSIELIEEIAPRGHFDFSTDYAKIFPVKVFMAMAGLPMEDAPKLEHFAVGMTRPTGDTPEEMAACLDAANTGFFDYVEPIINARRGGRSEEHTSELQSLMRLAYAVFCLQKTKTQ